MPSNNSTKGGLCGAIYVNRRDAKLVKNQLEAAGFLNKDYRMGPARIDSSFEDEQSLTECVAVPITHEYYPNESWAHLVVNQGEQFCPFSSAKLGNPRRKPDASSSAGDNKDMSLVQQALRNHLLSFEDKEVMDSSWTFQILELPICVCPRSLEVFGDDRTLVIPRKALRWRDLKHLYSSESNDTLSEKTLVGLWGELASVHGSPRVVRRGDIDPNSPTRESGHRLLWPPITGVSKTTGSGSPGWITVTEHGIRQSFDLTRVMFSRGNVTEKKRFGCALVQPGEIVLDMYAGIGYYTLPAILLGKARRVYACEWNPHAVEALRFNLKDNRVDMDVVTVLVGDCRRLQQEHPNELLQRVDRVSLGLLPSSQGGWRTAVQALHHVRGGWLHIHGNVPTLEVNGWKRWVAWSIHQLVEEEEAAAFNDWMVVCAWVERVKSFAPRINHYVADVFCGPSRRELVLPTNHPASRTTTFLQEEAIEADPKVWVWEHQRQGFVPCFGDSVVPPSCALSSDGVLHQDWMVEQ